MVDKCICGWTMPQIRVMAGMKADAIKGVVIICPECGLAWGQSGKADLTFGRGNIPMNISARKPSY